MPIATIRRRPEDAATLTLLLLKATLLGPGAGNAAPVATPRRPVLIDGVAATLELA